MAKKKKVEKIPFSISKSYCDFFSLNVFLHASVTISLKVGFWGFSYYLKCQSSSSVVLLQEILGTLHINLILMVFFNDVIHYLCSETTDSVIHCYFFPYKKFKHYLQYMRFSFKCHCSLGSQVLWAAVGTGDSAGDCTVTSEVTSWLHQLWVRHSWLNSRVQRGGGKKAKPAGFKKTPTQNVIHDTCT